MPIGRFLDDAARDFPQRTGTWTAGAELTWAELRERADRFAAALGGLGIGLGDRLAIVLPNLPATVIAVAAASRIGAVVVPLDPGLAPQELGRRLAQTGCRLAITTQRAVPGLRDARSHAPDLEHVVTTRAADWLPRRRRLGLPVIGRRRMPPAAEDGVIAWSELVGATTHQVPQAPVAGTDPAVIHYTAGTTGPARAVVLSTAAVVANAFQARLWIPDVRAGHERLLAALPFSHGYGFTLGLLTGMLSASTLVLVPRSGADELLATIEQVRPTLLPSVPSVIEALVAAGEANSRDLRSLRAGVCGGRPLDPQLGARFEALTGGGRLREGYGLTEAGPLTHANPIYGRVEPGSIGLPVSDTLACVVDPQDEDRPCAPGEVGLLLVRGPQVMEGYVGDPAASAAAFRDGWLVTGDLARMDPDGFFTVEGRWEPAIEGPTTGRESVA